MYLPASSISTRNEQWHALTVNLCTGERKSFFKGITERGVQDKLSGIFKEYKGQQWEKLQRGFKKETAAEEFFELEQATLQRLRRV